MADLTIAETALSGGRIRYTLGAGNWTGRRIPDIHRPGATIEVPERRMLDVICSGTATRPPRASARARGLARRLLRAPRL